MFNTELTTYKTGGARPSDKSLHPGEYGRASAWIKKIKNDLVLNKDIYGHPPSTVFSIASGERCESAAEKRSKQRITAYTGLLAHAKDA
jgi:hypothetical protein